MQKAAFVAEAAQPLAVLAADFRLGYVDQHAARFLVASPEIAGGAQVVQHNDCLVLRVFLLPIPRVCAVRRRARLAVR